MSGQNEDTFFEHWDAPWVSAFSQNARRAWRALMRLSHREVTRCFGQTPLAQAAAHQYLAANRLPPQGGGPFHPLASSAASPPEGAGPPRGQELWRTTWTTTARRTAFSVRSSAKQATMLN